MKRNRFFLISMLAVGLVLFAGLTYVAKHYENQTARPLPRVDDALLIKPHSPIKGPADAKVTLVEFLDPECEACRAMHPILKRLMSEYEGRLRVVIRYFPLHGNSKLAAVALEEAREQGKFDEALDLLFEKQPEWGDHSRPRPELIPTYLEQIGMDKKSLEVSSLMSKHGWKIDMDHSDGNQAGARLTPTFFVNGEILNEIGYGPLKQAIEKALTEE